MIDFNGMSTHVALFYILKLGKRIPCMFILLNSIFVQFLIEYE